MNEAPSNLRTLKLKYAVELRRTRVEGTDSDLPYVGLENIKGGTGRLVRPATTEPIESDLLSTGGDSLSALFEEGDLLFGKLRPYLAKAWIAEFKGRCSTELLVLRPEKIDSRFGLYVILSQQFIDAVDASTFGSKMPRADWEFIGNLPIPLPPQEKQLDVARFLDHETTDIDALINAKQRLLDLLAEKRRAIVAEAVMHGLNPGAPLRPSGIDWLGDIPAHWEAYDLKWIVASILSGVSVNAVDQPVIGNELGVLKTSAVIGGRLVPTENKAVWDTEFERLACPVKADSIIVSRMNTPTLVAESAYVETDYSNLFLPDRLWQIELDRSRAVTRFIAYVLSSHIVRSSLAEMATGTSASMKNLSQEDLLNFPIPLPPVNEQKEIIRYIDAETTSLDRLRSATEHSIALLKERRGALIAAAVTGQIDIPEAA
jgi:type I restriction enzyme S subunit